MGDSVTSGSKLTILANGSLVEDVLNEPDEGMAKGVDAEDGSGDDNEDWVAVVVLSVRVDRVVLLSERAGLCLNK